MKKITINNFNINCINKLKVRSLEIKDDKVTFLITNKEYNKLDKEIVIEELQIRKFTNFIKKYLISIIGFILISIALINQSMTIARIEFTIEENYNQEIIDYLNKYIKKVLIFNYLSEDLNTINSDLKSKFYEYEWISVNKKGSILQIDLRKLEEKKQIEDNVIIGDIISKKDAIIRKYLVKRGKVLISELMYVKKGDILVTGNLLYPDKELYIAPTGIIIGEVVEYKKIVINKEEIEVIKSGRINSNIYLSFFNKIIGKSKNKFTNYETKIDNIFKINNIISIDKITYYELITKIEKYNIEEAKEYGKSIIMKEFMDNKTSDLEKVENIMILKTDEFDDSYVITYIIRKYESIGEFIPK